MTHHRTNNDALTPGIQDGLETCPVNDPGHHKVCSISIYGMNSQTFVYSNIMCQMEKFHLADHHMVYSNNTGM